MPIIYILSKGVAYIVLLFYFILFYFIILFLILFLYFGRIAGASGIINGEKEKGGGESSTLYRYEWKRQREREY